MAAHVGVHARADLAVQNITRRAILVDQAVGLIAQVVFGLRPEQHLVGAVAVVGGIVGRFVVRPGVHCQVDVGTGQVDVVAAQVAAVGVVKDPAAQPVAGGLTPDVAVVADRAGLVARAVGTGWQGKGFVQVGGALHVLELVGVAGAGLDKAADKDVRRPALALLALLVDDGAEGVGVASL